jgi:hypothetical protein
LAGTLPAISQIVFAFRNNEAGKDGSFSYFLIGLVIAIAASTGFICLIYIPELSPCEYSRVNEVDDSEVDSTVDVEEEEVVEESLSPIIPLALSIFLCFGTTLSIFPAITASVSPNGGDHSSMFTAAHFLGMSLNL